ncbi:MAG TPA: HDIG domain-containing protein [Thermoanaerobaculia bacterium]|nr:HDIG domain-containing protein [Thermoanaerobaculia bacterium]
MSAKETTARIHLLHHKRRRSFRRWLRGPRALWRRALETPWIWVVLLLVGGSVALETGAFIFAPRLLAGAVADRDYVASRDLLLLDDAATLAKQNQARDKVLPVYDLDPGAIAQRDAALEQLFADGRQRAPAARDEAARAALNKELAAGNPAAATADALKLGQAQVALLAKKGFSAELEDRLRGVLGQALRRGVVANKVLLLDNRLTGITLRNLSTGAEVVRVNLFEHLGYPEETRDFLEAELRAWSGYSAAERRQLVELLLDNLTPNLHFNRSETLARQNLAAASAGQVFVSIRKGQMIARKGDVIDETKARVLAQTRGQRQLRSRVPVLAGTLVLLALAALVAWLGLESERVADHSRRRIFGESLLLLLLSLLGAKLCFVVAGSLSASFQVVPLNAWRNYAYAIPFAALALLAGLLLGRHAALVLSILFSILCSRLAIDGEPLWVVVYSLAGSLAAIYSLDRFQFRQRLVAARVGVMVGAVNVLMVLLLTALAGPADWNAEELLFELVCALAGGLLAAAVAGFAVPILESMLAITTDIKLVELSNTNLPLLRRLAFEAPGTFQHSLMVANLAKEACEAIGADPVLAYAGSLYHDVGKVFRSEYFIENQRPGQNRHDKLLPSMSVLILINHVKEGLELARQHHLPAVIRDAIEQHHGTRLIRYFYNRAQELADPEAGEVREADYRYPGPKPQNRVMGVLMLADGVEAASRTLIDATPAKIRALINTLVGDCVDDGQLDHTDLTLSDLKTVGDAFVRVLSTIFHQRVDYPGFDFNAVQRREKRPASGALRIS